MLLDIYNVALRYSNRAFNNMCYAQQWKKFVRFGKSDKYTMYTLKPYWIQISQKFPKRTQIKRLHVYVFLALISLFPIVWNEHVIETQT